MDSDRTIGCSQPPGTLRGEVGRGSAVAEPDRSPLMRSILALGPASGRETPSGGSGQGGYRSADHRLRAGLVWCVGACWRQAPKKRQKAERLDGGKTDPVTDPKMDRRGVEPVAGANRLGASPQAMSVEHGDDQQPVAQLVR